MRSALRLAVLVGMLLALGVAPAQTLAQGLVAPPTISKSFTPSSIVVGGTSVLSFTISNPNPGTALTGVAFTDTLPAGLQVANPSNLTGNCGGTVTAPPGSSNISLTGGLLAPSASCTISVNVTATTAGTKTNTTSPVTSIESGPGPPATATLTATAAPYAASFSVERLAVTGRTLTFRMIGPAKVRFTLDRRIAPKRYRRVGSFVRKARKGRNRVRIPRRLNGQSVKKGVYRLSARSVGGGMPSGPLERRIVRLR